MEKISYERRIYESVDGESLRGVYLIHEPKGYLHIKKY